jgi:hypothetical protein
MIAKQISSRTNPFRSFPNLYKYLTTESDPNTGEKRKRCTKRDILWPEDKFCYLEIAAYEMQGLASMNVRCKDPLYYCILSWPKGETPSRTQWHDATYHTLKSLGFSEHQYIAVALKNREHSTVHIMVNRVHPETLKAHTPSWSYIALATAARELEAKYGWQSTRGIVRWDDVMQTVVRVLSHPRSSYPGKVSLDTPPTAAPDLCSDRDKLLAYLRNNLATHVRRLLLRNNATWADLHSLFADHQLRFERRRHCPYTVFNPRYDVRVKASEVFLHNFGGTHARRLIERQLGPWMEM